MSQVTLHQSMVSANSPSSAPSLIPSPTRLGHKLIHLMETSPAVRLTVDITIIAVGILSIVSMIMFTGGQGLLLFFLIPPFIISAIGLTMLVSDISSMLKSQRLQFIADAIVAVVTPFLLLGVAAALGAIATIATAGTALLFANPLFSLSMIATGLAMVSLRKITFSFFSTYAQIKKQEQLQEQSGTHQIESTEEGEDLTSPESPVFLSPEEIEKFIGREPDSQISESQLPTSGSMTNLFVADDDSLKGFVSQSDFESKEKEKELAALRACFLKLHTQFAPPLQPKKLVVTTTSIPSTVATPPPLEAGAILTQQSNKIQRISSSAHKQRKHSDEDKDEQHEPKEDQENQKNLGTQEDSQKEHDDSRDSQEQNNKQ